MEQTIKSGSRVVRISSQQPNSFSARLWVNCRDNDSGDATLVARKFTTLKSAQKWAAKVLP